MRNRRAPRTGVANTAYSGNTVSIGEPTQGVVDQIETSLVDYGTNEAINIVAQPGSLPSGFKDTSAFPATLTSIDVPASWIDSGDFKNLFVSTNADVTLEGGVQLDLGPGGDLTIRNGEKLRIDGSVIAPGGSVNLTTLNDTLLNATALPNLVADKVVFSKHAVIDLNGLWVNDFIDPGLQTTVIQANGGNVSISAGKGVNLKTGSVIEASGGAWLSAKDKLTAGNGGNISIVGNTDFNPGQPGETTLYPVVIDAALAAFGVSQENGDVPGYAVGTGGTLSLEVPQLTIADVAAPSWGTKLQDLRVGGEKTKFLGTQVVLPASFFSSDGFSAYAITPTAGLTIAADTVIAPRALSLVLTDTIDTLPERASSFDVSGFAAVERLPEITRPAVSLSFKTNFATLGAPQSAAPNGGEIPGADILMEHGAVINTDPGAHVTLQANHQLTLYGSILAPAGSITLAGAALVSGSSPGHLKNDFDTTESVWIASGDVLSTAGTTLDYTDPVTGLTAGEVLSGGTISLSAPGGFINVQKGAEIDVAGTAGTVETLQSISQNLSLANYAETTLTSNGGTLALSATSGIFLDGNLAAASGGPTSAGGTLSVTLTDTFDGNNGNYNYAYPNSNRKIVIQQAGFSPVAASALKPGEALDETSTYGFDNELPYLQTIETFGPLYGKAYLSAAKIMSSGFSSLKLAILQTSGPTAGYFADTSAITNPSAPKLHFYDDSIEFAGSVALHLADSLTLAAENVTEITAAGQKQATVTLAAPYVDISAQTGTDIWGTSVSAGGSADTGGLSSGTSALRVMANLIDISGASSIDRFAHVLLESKGDIRLIENDDLAGQGLLSKGALTLDASQIYTTSSANIGAATNNASASGSFFVISDASVTLDRVGSAEALPISAGGDLTIDAPIISQDGTLRVPQGSLTLGCFTHCADYLPIAEQVTLGAGSITSVSLSGIDVPYGTVSNGLVWTAPDGNTLSAPPVKSLALDGKNIAINAGAVIDEEGGGDLSAYEFTPGVGGSNDVLAAANASGTSTVFAISPSYRGAYAPVDPAQTPNDGLTVGEQVYLSGGDGLAAGYYTLLPAHYALTPGTYAISIISNSVGFLPAQSYVETNGSALISGYTATANTPFRAAESEAFQITPAAVIQAQSQFDNFTANGFFPSFAAQLHVTTPQLPQDAGSLTLAPARALSIAGAFEFSPDAGGLGGFVSLQAATANGDPGNIAIIGGDEKAPAGYIGVSASQLSTLDSATLVIGGTIIPANTPTNSRDIPYYEATSANVLIDTGGEVLSSADLIFLGDDSIKIDADSHITATANGQPPVAGSAELLGGTLTSTPSFMEVSTGAETLLTQQQTAPLAGGSITIENGAAITSSDSVQFAGASATIGANAAITADSVEVTAQQIDLGAVPKTAGGLVLSGETLATLERSKALILHGLGAIDFYGDVTIGSVSAADKYSLNSLTLDSASLVGIGVNQAGPSLSIAAGSITLADSDGGLVKAAEKAAGKLSMIADTITIGSAVSTGTGTTIGGFAQSTLDARQQIYLRGIGKLAVDGALTINASDIVAATQSTSTDPLATETAVTTPVAESISATGALDIGRTGAETVAVSAINPTGGASVSFSGASITDDGTITLPAGALGFKSGGAVVFGAGSKTSVAGFEKSFFDIAEYASAGSISIAATGNVSVERGATIDLSAAAGGGNGGDFSIATPSGAIVLAGAITGHAGSGGTGGDVSLQATTLTDAWALVEALNREGFVNDVSLRATHGDLDLTGEIVAHQLTAAADSGAIVVSGKIDAAGVSDSEIALYAGGNLTLAAGAQLIATSSAASGTAGSIILSTTSGAIDTVAGAIINLTGGGYVDGVLANGNPNIVSGGTLLLRAPQTGDGGASAVTTDANGNRVVVGNNGNVGNTVAIDPIKATIVDARAVTVEAFLPYLINNLGGKDALIGAALEAALRQDASQFMTHSAAIVTALGETSNPRFTLSPGEEIEATGNLFLTSDWDLHTWRYGPKDAWPGILTLRAGGNLTLQASLSDGFIGTPTTDPTGILVDTPSWSYRLIGGADLAAADPDATAADSSSSFELAINPYSATDNRPGATGGDDEAMYVVRTGTGFIDVSAAQAIKIDGDIDYPVGGYAHALNTFDVLNIGGSSSIYTVGLSAGGLAGFTAPSHDYPVNPLAEINGQIVYDPVYYTTDGGSISLQAGGNIVGPTDTTGPGSFANGANQFIYQWFYTEGSVSAHVQPSWWSDFTQFQQGVGALGGGSINVTAGGDIDFLGFAIPSNGRVREGLNSANQYSAGNLLIQAGGNLYVNVRGNLQDDLFFVGDGNGVINVGKSILAPLDTSAIQLGTDASFGTSIALGAAQISITTGGNLVLSQIFDPTAAFASDAATYLTSLPNPPDQNNSSNYGNDAEIVNYAPTSSVDLRSAGGSVTYLGNSPSSFDGGSFASSLANFGGLVTAGFGYLPGTASFVAFGGDTDFDGSITLTPNTHGELNIAAANAVTLAGNQPLAIVQLGISADAVPTVADPAAPANGGIDPLATIASSTDYAAASAVPIAGVNHVYALGEDLYNQETGTTAADFVFAKPSEVRAGRDIIDIGVVGQNFTTLDETSVIAGRDIIFDVISPTGFDYTTPILGDYASLGADDIYGFQLGGPGVLDVEAGRNIELAGSNGILTYGNSVNPYLSTTGANIVVIAGGVPNYTGFVDQYVNPAGAESSATTLASLATFMTDILGHTVDQSEAWATFKKLSLDDQAEFAREVYFAILKSTADPTNPAYKLYQDGYQAASVLFPKPTTKASLDLFYSEVETQNGGGIQLFTPGGGIQVGLTDQPSVSGSTDANSPNPVLKTGAQLGIFTVNGGEIDSFSQGSVEVNLSRIFTDDGGDLVLWSTDGDIDAGKGAKTALAAPPPIEEIDAAGNIVSIPAGAATGSGIAILAPPGRNLFNSAYLIAPNGTVNAGDAGLRATGNINVVAERVVNASNIQAGGSVSGVPQAPSIALAALSAASSASNAAGNAGDVTDQEHKRRAQPHHIPSIITVTVLGYGGS